MLNSYKYSTYEDVLNEFIQKSTGNVIRQGAKKVLEVFDRIGLKKSELFSWSAFNEEVQSRFIDWNDKKLDEIFNERHSIVHDNAIPIKSIDELLLRQDFFIKIILNISVQSWHKFYKYGIILDSHEQIRKAIKASGGDPESYPPPPTKGF